ncbi:MAG: DUF2147 domain-containing protein [Bacteroidota bacterium]|nr:DUF2147 domain-containing protein [Bacteroidota bacterium]
MMKILFISLMAITGAFKAMPQNNPDAIIGRWMSSENNLEVEIFKTANEYNAKVIWIDDSDDKSRPMNVRCDKNNPDEKLRNRKIIGLEVMFGLTYNARQNEWYNGKIYDPDSGKEWNAKAWLTKDGILKVRGYWDFQFIGKDLMFRKIL